jgi:dipeptidyl aminopeptidase/acylaminoacyl peptidase
LRITPTAIDSLDRLFLMALIILLSTCGLRPAHAAAPLEAYGRLPSLEEVSLSPDGTKLAFVSTTEDFRAFVVMSLGDRKVLGGGKVGDAKLRELTWADNDHLLIISSATELPYGFVGEATEWYRLMVYEVSTHRMRGYPEKLPEIDMMANAVDGDVMVRHLGDDTVLYIPGLYVASHTTRLALFKVNLKTGSEIPARFGSEATRGWVVDGAGNIVAESDYYEHDQQWQLKIRRGDTLVEAQSRHAPIDVPRVMGLGPKGDSVLIAAIEDGDSVWRQVSLGDGSLGPPMEERAQLTEPIEDPRTHRMIGGVHIGEDTKYVFFDAALSSRWQSILDAFEGERVRLISTSADMMRFVVRVDGPQHGFAYQLVDMNTHRTTPIGNVYDGIKQSMEVRRISYAAADGFRIPAYLTLPSGRPPTKLPLIVFPHGGPAARDTDEFDWWAQAMASQGYAVLQANYRGSALDWEFVSAGFGEWGRKMQTDLSDGVRYLAKEGVIDPGRVCIVGASYGGYAALAGVTLDPGVFRCAVSVAGISDLKRFLQWINLEHSHISNRYWDRFMGVENYRDLNLDSISPIRHLDQVNVPVLLIHGRDDTVVPFEQSDIMLSAMKRVNKNVELVTLKREDHWLSRSATRLQMLQSSMAFLKANNSP